MNLIDEMRGAVELATKDCHAIPISQAERWTEEVAKLNAIVEAARDIDEYVDLSPEDIPENHKYCAYCGYKKPDGHWKVCPMNALQEKLDALDEERRMKMNNLLEEKIKMLQEADKGGASLAPIDYALLDLWEENKRLREDSKRISRIEDHKTRHEQMDALIAGVENVSP